MHPCERNPFELWQKLKFIVTFTVQFMAPVLGLRLYQYEAPLKVAIIKYLLMIFEISFKQFIWWLLEKGLI